MMKTMWTNPLGNQRGNLVGTLVALGITSVLILAIFSIMDHLYSENKALSEKMAALDLQRTITQALSNPAICGAMFASSNLVTPTSLPFDSTSIATNPYTFALREISSGGSATALAVAGEPAGLMSSSLSLLKADAKPTSGITIRVTSMSPPSGLLLVNFDQQKLVRSIRNLSFPLSFNVSGPADKTMITGCAGSASGGGTVRGLVSYTSAGTYSFVVPANVTNIWVRVVGAGGGGAGSIAGLSGGGGGAGGYTENWVSVTPGQNISLVVGAGGAGGLGGSTNSGGQGGTSTFNGTLSASGGAGGVSKTAPGPGGTNGVTSGGAPGVGSGGSINLSGGYGNDGNGFSEQSPGGIGGASAFGGGGRTSAVSHFASDAKAPGSGGGSGWAHGNVNGGNGADGAVFISY